MKNEYLEAGKIVNTHGIRGEVKIMPYCDSPELLCEFDRLFMGKSLKEIYIERSRVQKNMIICKIEGVDTPEEAEKLRNKMLYMHRDDLELDEDTYFIQDLIGMTVKNADTDEIYGTIDDVFQTGANDVYVGCTHGVLSGPAIERIEKSDLKELVMTNTIPLPQNKQIDRITVVSMSELFGEAIKRINEATSIGELFE